MARIQAIVKNLNVKSFISFIHIVERLTCEIKINHCYVFQISLVFSNSLNQFVLCQFIFLRIRSVVSLVNHISNSQQALIRLLKVGLPNC